MKRLRASDPDSDTHFLFFFVSVSLSLSFLDFVCFRLVLPTVSYVVSCIVNTHSYHVSDLALLFFFLLKFIYVSCYECVPAAMLSLKHL